MRWRLPPVVLRLVAPWLRRRAIAPARDDVAALCAEPRGAAAPLDRALPLLVLAVFGALLGWSTTSFGASPAQGSFNGNWAGTTSQNKPFSFTVAGGAVTSLDIQFTLPDCTVRQTITGNIAISNNAFTVSTAKGTIQGTFNGAVFASGTASYSNFTPPCTGTANVTWNAFNTIPSTSTPTSSPTITTTPSATNTPSATSTTPATLITIGDFFYAPQSVAVATSGLLRWKNEGLLAHTVTSPLFGDVVVQPGASFDFPFTNAPPGVYAYFCRFHSSMIGSVTVGDVAPPTNTPTATSTSTPTRAPAQPQASVAYVPLVAKAADPATTPTATATPTQPATDRPQVTVVAAREETALTCDGLTQRPATGLVFVVVDFTVRNPQPGQPLTFSRSDVNILASDGAAYKADGRSSGSAGDYCLGGTSTYFDPSAVQSYSFVFVPPRARSPRTTSCASRTPTRCRSRPPRSSATSGTLPARDQHKGGHDNGVPTPRPQRPEG